MLMEHFLCDDVGGKRNVCGMGLFKQILNIYSTFLAVLYYFSFRIYHTTNTTITSGIIHKYIIVSWF